MVPKLLLICTKVGWSAQPYSINFAFTHGSSARIHFLTFTSLLEEMHLHEGSDQGNCLSLWRNVETRAGEKKLSSRWDLNPQTLDWKAGAPTAVLQQPQPKLC